MGLCFHVCLNSTLWGWGVSLPHLPLNPGEIASDTHCRGDWASPTADLNALEKKQMSFPCRKSNHESCSLVSTPQNCSVPVRFRFSMREGQFVHLLHSQEATCEIHVAVLKLAGVWYVETPPVASFLFNCPCDFLCKMLLSHATSLLYWHECTASWNTLHTQVMKTATGKKKHLVCSRLCALCGWDGSTTGVWALRFAWRWLHCGIWRPVVWVVGTNLLLPPFLGYILFLAFQQNNGFSVKPPSHPRARPHMLTQYQVSDKSWNAVLLPSQLCLYGRDKKHGVG